MKGDATTSCSSCSAKQIWLLHNVRHRGDFQRYCTSCVLKLHPGSFCPHCFDVFEGPPPNDSLRCSKCPSVSHSSCIATENPSRYVCPTCSNPSFLFFNPEALGKNGKVSDGERPVPCGRRVIGLTSAKVLLAAARISAQSMSRASAAARLEADRKVREAAFSRKRAREALERAAFITSKEAVSKGGLASGLPLTDQKKKPKVNTPATAVSHGQNQLQNCAGAGNLNRTRSGENMKGLEVAGMSALAQRLPKNGQLQGSRGSVLVSPLHLNKIVKEENEKSLKLPEPSAEDKGGLKGFQDSGVSTQTPKLNRDPSLSKANSGVTFTGSQSTSLLS